MLSFLRDLFSFQSVSNERAADQRARRLREIPPELSEKLGNDVISELEYLYELADEDRSGVINKNELIQLLRASGMNPIEQNIDDMLEEIDENNDGTVSFAEFVTLWDKYLERAIEEEEVLRIAFQYFDVDDSDSISREEFEELMAFFGDPLSKEELDKFFVLVDKDGDGQVSGTEFMRLANAQRHFLEQVYLRKRDWERRHEERNKQRASEPATDASKSGRESSRVPRRNVLQSLGSRLFRTNNMAAPTSAPAPPVQIER